MAGAAPGPALEGSPALDGPPSFDDRATIEVARGQSGESPARAARSGGLVRVALIAVGLGFLGVIVVLPIAAVLVEAFRDGVPAYFRALVETDALAAVRVTL